MQRYHKSFGSSARNNQNWQNHVFMSFCTLRHKQYMSHWQSGQVRGVLDYRRLADTSSPSSIIFHLCLARQQTGKILQNYLVLVPYWNKPLLKEPNMSKSRKNNVKNLLCNKCYIWRRSKWQNKIVGESLKIWAICCLFLYLLVFMLETCSWRKF